MEVAGDAAVARVELDYPGARITDFFSLARLDGRWQIINKLYHVGRNGGRASAPGGPARRPSGDAAAITAASAAFSAACMTGDTATIRQLYTDDALLLAPERDVHGPSAAARYFAPNRARRNVHHAMASERLEIDGDRAIDVGTWFNTWQLDGQDARTASGRYLVVWRKGADARWRMAYDMWHRPRQ